MKISPVLSLCVLLGLTTLTAPGMAWGQETPDAVGAPRGQYTFQFGLGAGSEGLGGQLGLTLHHAAGEFMVRTAGTFEIDIFGGSASYNDLAVLFGHRTKSPSGWLAVAAGPSLVWTDTDGECREWGFLFCDEYAHEKSQALGLALAFDAVWSALRSLGVGIGGFANLNGAKSFAGATLSLHLGQVR